MAWDGKTVVVVEEVGLGGLALANSGLLGVGTGDGSEAHASADGSEEETGHTTIDMPTH